MRLYLVSFQGGRSIQKANKQIKAFKKECYGLVVIDISEKINNPNDFTDAIPANAERISNIISNAIKTSCTSVSAVLLVWNDYTMMGTPPEDPMSLVAFRKRAIVLKHSNPKHTLPEGISLFDFGNTLHFYIFWNAI